tara:strand:+ start:281 stop:445 length:165 start_codon:yes stop_codon:yes gene_type:complete
MSNETWGESVKMWGPGYPEGVDVLKRMVDRMRSQGFTTDNPQPRAKRKTKKADK